jgi:glycosyltransferase involved in cell wall biosynthesis
MVPRISVIISTWNRPDGVMRTLESLARQDWLGFEVLVVDNAADQRLAESAAKFAAGAPIPVRYVPEPQLGLHNARHAGARAATGEILVFTDDDATFYPSWLRSFAEAFSAHPDMPAAGGPVRPAWEATPPDWVREFAARKPHCCTLALMEPWDDFQLSPKAYFFGVNMAIRRPVFFDLGGFNPEAFGDTWLGDGDTGLYLKLRKRGLSIGYVPGALVHHHIPPKRMTLDYLLHWSRNQGASEAYTRYHPHVPSSMMLLKDALVLGVTNLPLWAKNLLRHKGRVDQASLAVQIQSAGRFRQIRYAMRLAFDGRLRRLVAWPDWLNNPPPAKKDSP